MPETIKAQFRLDIGRADKGRTFIRVVHIPTGKNRIQIGLGSDDPYEIGNRLTEELKAELELKT